MKSINYENSHCYAERFVMDGETIIEIWLTGQKSPVGAVAAAFLDNGNRKAESGIWLNDTQVHFASGDQYSIEEHKDKVPGIGIANRVKLLHVQATGKCDPNEPFYITAPKSHYRAKPPKQFYGRLFQASHIAAEPNDIQSLWDYGFFNAMYAPLTEHGQATLLKPIEEIEGHNMWGYKIKGYPSLWWSVQRRFKQLIHIVTGRITSSYWRYNSKELFDVLTFDERYSQWWDWRFEDETVLLYHRRGEEWVEVAKHEAGGSSIYNNIIYMAAHAGIELMFEDQWVKWEKSLRGEDE